MDDAILSLFYAYIGYATIGALAHLLRELSDSVDEQ